LKNTRYTCTSMYTNKEFQAELIKVNKLLIVGVKKYKNKKIKKLIKPTFLLQRFLVLQLC